MDLASACLMILAIATRAAASLGGDAAVAAHSPAGASAMLRPRCSWIRDSFTPDTYCDLSSAYILSPAAGTLGDAALDAPRRALLAAAAADVACGELAAADACALGSGCFWDGESSPGCGLDATLAAQALAAASLCPESPMAAAFPCALAVTEDDCAAAGDGCRWSANSPSENTTTEAPSAAGGQEAGAAADGGLQAGGVAAAGGACNHESWLAVLGGPLAVPHQGMVRSRHPDVWGSCREVQALFQQVSAADACLSAAGEPACAALAPRCRWAPPAAAGGPGACTATRAAALAAAGFAVGEELSATAAACMAAQTRQACVAAGGAPVEIDGLLLSQLSDGADFGLRVGSARLGAGPPAAPSAAAKVGWGGRGGAAVPPEGGGDAGDGATGAARNSAVAQAAGHLLVQSLAAGATAVLLF